MYELMEQYYYIEPLEAKYIRQANEKLLDVFFYELKRLRRNQYILTADEMGIEALEHEFKIIPNPVIENLDFRRQRLIGRNTTKPPFTYEYLLERLDALCGAEHYKAALLPGCYWLRVRLELPIRHLYQEAWLTVRRMVPANMTMEVDIRYRMHQEMQPYTHRQYKFYTHREIRELVPIVTVSCRELKQRFTNRELSAYKNRKISRREIALMPLMAYEALKAYRHRQMKYCTHLKISRRELEQLEFTAYQTLTNETHGALHRQSNRQIAWREKK